MPVALLPTKPPAIETVRLLPLPRPRVNAPPVAFKFHCRSVVMGCMTVGWVSLPDRRHKGEQHMRRVLARFWKYTRPRGEMTIQGAGLVSHMLNINVDMHMGIM